MISTSERSQRGKYTEEDAQFLLFYTEVCASIKARLKLAVWVIYCYVTNHSKSQLFKAVIIIYFVHESVIWPGLQWGWFFADSCGISCNSSPGPGRSTFMVIHSHASKMVLAIGWSYIRTVENNPQCPSFWASPGASWISLHNDIWMPRRRVPSGKCMTFLHPILGSHTVSSSLTSVGSGSHKDPPSFKWRESTLHVLLGNGRVIEVL